MKRERVKGNKKAEAGNYATNVLIMGKTGVGKSSFINYLYPDAEREVGAGRPVTGKSIHKNTLKLDNGLTVNLYDTWGLEANKAGEWKKIIIGEVRRNNLSNVRDWFHTIIYCLSAKSARVEPFETEQINMLLAEGNRVLVVLTHCDLNNVAAAADSMAEILCRDCDLRQDDIVRISSVLKKLLGGATRGAFGKDMALDRITSNLWEAVAERIPKNLRLFGIRRIDKWYGESLSAIENGIDFFNQFSNDTFKAVSAEINDNAARCRADFGRYAKGKLDEALDYYHNFLEKHESAALGDFHPELPGLPRFRSKEESQSTEDKIIEIIAMTIFPIAIPYTPGIKRDKMKKSLDSFRSKIESWLDKYLSAVRDSLC
ncbi:MAG: GTPase domain-containing protein [Synergistaceae bacterium]|nr:GTPase domain-containing protein [Synergistaceae bacterium]